MLGDLGVNERVERLHGLEDRDAHQVVGAGQLHHHLHMRRATQLGSHVGDPRRALLSQGYIIDTSRKDLVEGNKNFQPEAERHLQMHIRVVCATESADGKLSVGFVTALQDTYALRKASNSASVGVSALGSLSLPFSAGHDSMIKVGSETIQSERFYESFFELMRRYLLVDAADVATSPAESASAKKP